MKNLKIWSFMAVLLMAMVGCNDTPDNGGSGNLPTGNLDGIEKEWKLVSVNGTPSEFNIYIGFEQGSFCMFQQLYTLDYQLYEGEYSIDGNKLTGSYFDHGDWKCAYTGGISEDGNTLTLKSDETESITCVYEACTIPDSVREEASNQTRGINEIVPFL